MKTEKLYQPISGYLGLLLAVIFICGVIFSAMNNMTILLIISILILTLSLIGLIAVQPNKACVLVLFGAYKGTIKQNGFFWVNPFFVKKMISLRAQNFNCDPIKVNDKVGNPIMIGLVLVWKVEDTFKAAFEVDKYEHFVVVQSEAALRKLAGMYPY
ncbi:MAG TPA: SPFH domain-containing protein, partial [Bacteroidales bacterium]